jgi:hypothetical protein
MSEEQQAEFLAVFEQARRALVDALKNYVPRPYGEDDDRDD